MPQERVIRVDWTGERLRFRGGGIAPETPRVVIDGDGEVGPSPMVTLLLALAGCSGSDVVAILEKMRVRLRTLEIEVRGTRRDEAPRRFIALHLRFRIVGDGLDRAKAERAVTLSLEKYCSVVHSLAPDIAIQHEIALA